jgi:thiol-disulfide isomerase/thioredoxin
MVMSRAPLAWNDRRHLLRGSRPLPVACLAIATVFGCFATAEAQRAPDFTLKDLSGRAWSLNASSSGKVVLLDFWATWCVPCVKELPHLQRLQDAYGEKGLQVVTISIDGPDGVASVSGFVARYGFSFPVLLDTESRVVSVYDPSLILPYSVLVDRTGVTSYVHQGYSPGDERLLEEKIAALLDEPEQKPRPGPSARANESFLFRVPRKGSEGTDPDSTYTECLNQLDMTLTSGGLLAGARLDTNLDLSPRGGELRLAKRYAQYSTNRFQARAGDYYTSLGRGARDRLMQAA